MFETPVLHEGQAEVLNFPARFKVVVAGRRWGKTQTAKTAIVRAARIKKRLVWYVAPTYRMAKDIMWTELVETIPKKWIKKVNETLLEIRLINGTTIQLKGADKPDTLRGVGLHYLVIDEAQDLKEETWSQVLRPTLASTGGHALIIGTPKGFQWLYDLYMLGQNEEYRKKGEWASWQMPTITSPFIPRQEIEAAKRDMDEKSFNQEFCASFETMSGRVYHCFDRNTHIGSQYEFDPKKPIWVGMDFNVDPMSAVILQPQEDGETIWAVDEIVLFSSNTEEMADELERKYWRHLKQLTIFPDPAGANRSHTRGESDLQVLRDKGFKRIKHRRKHPRVADRVNSVNRMLKTADGTIRLYVNPVCKKLIEGLEQTIYKPGSRDVDKSAGVEHSCDALGYPVELNFPVRKFKAMGVSL
jgi:phage terminase large subunit